MTVICGPMFTGKTTALIDRLEAAGAAGDLTVIAVKPSLDDRYHPTNLTTHDGRSHAAHTIERPEELVDLAGDVIGLDEGHFFEEGLHGPVMTLVDRGVHVLVAGLDRTSMNEPFGEMGRLLVEADEVVKLAGRCAVCGRPAVHTVRLFDSTESIVVGGPGMFENRCRAHLSAPRNGVDFQ
ncbi:MAG: thymidine kinase [Proteobacteria bacterium]|nr:thymidine kinase [Pseudomonadota bacterium]